MKIAFIDLEGTLILGSEWNNLKDKFSAKELSDKYGKLYDEGKVGFEEWRQELSKIWHKNKVTKEQFIHELKKYKILSGAKELISGLKKKCYKTVIVTGAISVLGDIIQKDLGIDEIYCAHEFVFDKKGIFLEIKTHPDYGRGQGKVKMIKDIIKKYKADEKDCITIGGDDINDYWMMKEFNSFAVNSQVKQIIEVAKHNVNKLVDILHYI
jgi:HAD superfamily phosphoserine phosphatase-like hydrolase